MSVRGQLKKRAPFLIKPVRLSRRWVNRLRHGKLPEPQSVTHQVALSFFEEGRARYEELVSAVAPLVPPGGVIVDVGANIGFFSHLLMTRIGFRGKAHLFEPVPNLARLCATTFAQSSFDVTINCFGLGDENTEATLYLAANGNIGWNTLIKDRTQEDMSPIRIQIKRYDDLGLATPDFVKIDVEGAEYRVLEGMYESVKAGNRLPVILCEIGWGQSHPNYEDTMAVLRRYGRLGYSYTEWNGQHIDVAKLESTKDVLFVPPRR